MVRAIKPEEVEKVWGSEQIYVNRDYCGKVLNLKRGFRCSLHLHQKKHETFLVIDGLVYMEVGEVAMTFRSGEAIEVPPGTLHRFTGLQDSKIVEFSSHHDDEDSYRKELSGSCII